MKTTNIGDAKIFPLVDAQLAVDIAAVREQLMKLSARTRDIVHHEEVHAHINSALSALIDAVHATLIVDKR